MKIVISLLLVFITLAAYAEEIKVQNLTNTLTGQYNASSSTDEYIIQVNDVKEALKEYDAAVLDDLKVMTNDTFKRVNYTFDVLKFELQILEKMSITSEEIKTLETLRNIAIQITSRYL